MEYLSIRSEVDPKLRTTLSNERRSHLGQITRRVQTRRVNENCCDDAREGSMDFRCGSAHGVFDSALVSFWKPTAPATGPGDRTSLDFQ